jgi:hypothetical protein
MHCLDPEPEVVCDQHGIKSSSIPYDIQSLQFVKRNDLSLAVFVDASCTFLPFAVHQEVKLTYLDHFKVSTIEVSWFAEGVLSKFSFLN